MITSQRILDFLRFCLFLSSGLGMRSLKLQLPEDRPSGSLQDKGSQAGVLAVIHKSGKAGKAVISAGMPKSRPWTVIGRLCNCLIQETCHPVVSCPQLQGHLSWPRVCHPWTLDFGIHAEKTGLQHLCITARAGAWDRASRKLFRPYLKPFLLTLRLCVRQKGFIRRLRNQEVRQIKRKSHATAQRKKQFFAVTAILILA